MAAAETEEHDTEHTPEWRLRRALETRLGVGATEGNRIEVLRNGTRIFPKMLEAVENAAETIDFMTFVYWKGEIAEQFAHALGERARAGVEVRVLLDALGARLIESELVAMMTDCGVQVRWYRKPWKVSPLRLNHRLHRKVLVVDQVVGFTGGVGIAAEWMGDARDADEWRDTHVKVSGPAVDGLIAAFAQNWTDDRTALTPEGRTPVDQPVHDDGVTAMVVRGSGALGWSDMATVWRAMIESAQGRLRIATAYFQPDDAFCSMLCEAVERGVQVDVLVPGTKIDKRISLVAGQARYDQLLEAGVRIHQFQPSMFHCKICVVDETAAMIGSSNLNRRSLHHDEEIMLVAIDPATARTLAQDFDDDLERSKDIEPGRWDDRGLLQRSGEQVSRVLRHWL